jgi:hypothetical protein
LLQGQLRQDKCSTGVFVCSAAMVATAAGRSRAVERQAASAHAAATPASFAAGDQLPALSTCHSRSSSCLLACLPHRHQQQPLHSASEVV